MNKFILLIAVVLTGCGLDPLSIAQKAAATDDTSSGHDCAQPYNEIAYLENHTGQPVNITMAYSNYADYSSAGGTVTVQIPVDGIWSQVLQNYTQTNYGSYDSDGKKSDATCTSTPQKAFADLSTFDGTSTVRRCRVKKGVAYLVAPSSPCPDYTYE